MEAFIGKIIQLYEMIVVRHGLMLVGLSYGMKTAAHKVLAAALSDLHAKVYSDLPCFADQCCWNQCKLAKPCI